MIAKISVATLCGFLLATGCSRETADLYNRYNLHYVGERASYYGIHGSSAENRASYANWTKCPNHSVLPYNTRLRATFKDRRIYFVAPDIPSTRTKSRNFEIEFEVDPRRIGMTATEYASLITLPTPVSYEGLSDIDREGIEAGEAMVGMTKQGVMIALGYPAKHYTPSLEKNRWYYWEGRISKYAVVFDDAGKVVSIGD